MEDEVKEVVESTRDKAPVYKYLGTEESAKELQDKLNAFYGKTFKLLRDCESAKLYVFRGFADPVVWGKVRCIAFVEPEGKIRFCKERINVWR